MLKKSPAALAAAVVVRSLMPRVYIAIPLLLLCACDQLPRRTIVAGGTNYELRRDDKDQVVRVDNATGEKTAATPSQANSSATKTPAARTVPSSAEQSQGLVPPRYDLLEDVDGRIVRLDVDTGEVAIISNGQATPVDPAKPGAPAASPTAAAQPGSMSPNPLDVILASPPPGSTSLLTIETTAPVFLFPDATRSPLRVLGAGSIVKLLETHEEWYQIAFEDPVWRVRVGFVARNSAVEGAGTASGSGPLVKSPAANQTAR
jgi:hypothetical protein